MGDNKLKIELNQGVFPLAWANECITFNACLKVGNDNAAMRGCCFIWVYTIRCSPNAYVVEAMACGLPVISSNKEFNWDVLNDENSIMVAPMNVDELARAIATLRDDKRKRKAMAEAA